MPWTAPPTFTPGQVVTATDLNTYLRDNPSYLFTRPNGVIKRLNAANYSTTSTSFVDIDGTNLAVTLALTGSAVLVTFIGKSVSAHTPGDHDFTIDGARFANTTRGLAGINSSDVFMSYCVLVTGLSAGSHVFKPQWKITPAADAYLYSDSTTFPVIFSVQEVG